MLCSWTAEPVEAFACRNKMYQKLHEKMVRYGSSDWLGQNKQTNKNNPLSQIEIGWHEHDKKGNSVGLPGSYLAICFFILVGSTSWLLVSVCGVIRLLPWPQKDLVWPCTVASIRHDNCDVTFKQQFQEGLCNPVVKKGRPWLGLVLPQRFVQPQMEAVAAVSSYICPSDKVEETWLAFLQQQRAADSTHGRRLSVWKPFFSPHVFFLSVNLPKSACPCSLCEHVTVRGRYQPPTTTSCQQTRQGQKAAVQPDEEM